MPSTPTTWVFFAAGAAGAVAAISWGLGLTLWPGVVISLLVSVWSAAKSST